MRNKKDFRNGVFERYNREKRKRELRRKNLSAAALSFCMVFVILFTGSVFLSASFGVSLFEDVDASFDLIFDAIGNNAQAPTYPEDLPAPGEKEEQTKDNDFAPECDSSIREESSECQEGGSLNEGITDERNADTETSPSLPEPVETVPKTDSSVSRLPETTKAPEYTKAPETTKAPENADNEAPTVPPTSEAGGDEAGFWRVLFLGSAFVCLAVCCVFVYRALKKEN